MTLKCISLWQPWASAVAYGLKRFETRGYPTRHRGPLGIYATLKDSKDLARLFVLFSGDHPEFARTMLSRGHALFESLPFGKLVCVVDVVGCQPTTSFSRANRPDLMERDLGNFSRGRYAWRLENPRPFSDPPKAVGKQGFFFVRLSPLQMRQVGIKEAA